MKLSVIALVCLSCVAVVSAQQAGSSDPVTPWSVVGTWNTVHQHWARPIIISADGRFFVDHGDHRDYGSWRLAAETDHLNLVLGWDGWEPETVALIGPDEFQGKVPTGRMILRRNPCASSPDGAQAQGRAPAGPSPTPAPALSPEASPCGSWVWQHNATINLINANGTVGREGDKGTWHWIDQPGRKLQIDWKGGFVDTLTIAPDGKTMNVVNNADDEFTVRRVRPPANEP